MKYSIGIDVGGTGIKAGIVDEHYVIVKSRALPTLSQDGGNDGERVVAAMEKLARELCEDVGCALSDIRSIGAGIPGSIDRENGVVVYTNNIDLHDLPLRDMFFARTGHSLEIGNDADVAALGEYAAGAAAGCSSCVMITLGTGVGSGIIMDGKIYSGSHNRGGELGHTVIQADGGEPCTCGREGCLEAYASATGLIRMTRRAMEQDEGSMMWALCEGDAARADGKTAFTAAAKGDLAGRLVLDEYIRYLGCGIANIINILHPERICMGGGISKSGDELLLPLRIEAHRGVYGGADEKTTQIVLASLGSDAGIIGAAVLGAGN